jgi:hypothetical protein
MTPLNLIMISNSLSIIIKNLGKMLLVIYRFLYNCNVHMFGRDGVEESTYLISSIFN